MIEIHRVARQLIGLYSILIFIGIENVYTPHCGEKISLLQEAHSKLNCWFASRDSDIWLTPWVGRIIVNMYHVITMNTVLG